MTIIDANEKHDLYADKIQQFFNAMTNDSISVVINKEQVITTTKQNFVKDVLESDAINAKYKLKHGLLIVCTDMTSATLLFDIEDYLWYFDHTRRLNKLTKDLYGAPEEKPQSVRTKRAMQLQLEEKTMAEQRIVGIVIGNDVNTIEAFKGDGWQCAEWLNKQFVLKHEKLAMLKICLNLTTTSKLTDFAPINTLVESGVIVLC